MKYLKIITLFSLLAIMVLSSCQKETLVDTQIDEPTIQPTEQTTNGLVSRAELRSGGLELICINIAYPFDMIRLDSTTVSVTSETDFEAALEDFDNPVIDFVYPLDVTDEDGNVSTVANADELGVLFSACIPDYGWDIDTTGQQWMFPAWNISSDDPCYDLVYPLDLLDQDSTVVPVADEPTLISLLSDGNFYSFAFPLTLENQEDSLITVNDGDALFDLLAKGCSTDPVLGGCGIGTFVCYELVYPVSLVAIDGSIEVVNDDNEFAEALISDGYVRFAYPLTLSDVDGNVIVVNDDAELDAAILACSDINPGGGGGSGGGDPASGDFVCYDFVYPISFLVIDGTTITFADEAAWETYYDDPSNLPVVDFAYPVTLEKVDDGTQVIINVPDDLNTAIQDCF